MRLSVFRFSEAFKLHSMLSSCCYCYTPYRMVLPNWTPLSTGVQQIYYMDFVRLSPSLWSCFIPLKKSIK